MSAQAITLHLPGFLYDLFQRKTQQSHQSVEAVLLEAVTTAAPKVGQCQRAGVSEATHRTALAISLR